jgi:hypothetical protein
MTPSDLLITSTLFVALPEGSRLSFLPQSSLGTSAENAEKNPSCRSSFLLDKAFQAGSDSGEISSTCPRCSFNTRWQRRANAKLCVAMREVS